MMICANHTGPYAASFSPSDCFTPTFLLTNSKHLLFYGFVYGKFTYCYSRHQYFYSHRFNAFAPQSKCMSLFYFPSFSQRVHLLKKKTSLHFLGLNFFQTLPRVQEGHDIMPNLAVHYNPKCASTSCLQQNFNKIKKFVDA